MNSLPSLLILMFMMGFMGSLHCVGMCGGLVTAVSISTKKTYWAGLLIYQLGRLSTYSLLGLLLGMISLTLHGFSNNLIQPTLAIMAGSLMIIFALNLAGLLPDPLRRLSSGLAYKIGLIKLISQLAKHARLRGWYALGLVNGLLPCGLVYAALAMSLSTEKALDASLMMCFFGLGTVPAMMFVPAILQKLSPTLRLNTLRVAAILMLTLGFITILRGMSHTHIMVPQLG